MAGSRAVEAKALAESKAVTIALEDHSLNEILSTADVLEVRGEGATLQVPLEGSTAALARVACKSPKARHATRARSALVGRYFFPMNSGQGSHLHCVFAPRR